ncbi:hypothetical protein [Clostridium sp.]|jgi:hypothetical protein|uniref:hypothetical protein n=1 Tax=Clostridium sp. TaxID=1506 RepID=UPI002FDE6ECE
MIDIILNDIKGYARRDKKKYLYFILTIFLIAFSYVICIPHEKFNRYAEYIFLLIFCCILIQGMYSMQILVLDPLQLKNTKFLFVTPVTIKIFVISKNIEIFACLFIQFIILRLIFTLSNISLVINLGKNLSLMSAIIYSVAIANIYLFFNHKKAKQLNEGSKEDIIKSIKVGFVSHIITILGCLILIFFVIRNNIMPIINIISSILGYILSYIILINKMKKQAKFLEEIEKI